MAARRKTPSVLTALNKALRSAPADDRDEATIALAKRYASELDDAVVVSRAMQRALRKLSRLVDAGDVDDELYESFAGLATRVEEVHVAATIGPKLLTALDALQLTPAARKNIIKGGGASAGDQQLDELRKRREARASSVDSPTS